MRTFSAVVLREIRNRWQLPAAAVLLGVLAWAAPWLPRLGGFDPTEVRSGAAMVASLALLVGAAVALGSAMISRGLAEGRLAFYYVRPIGAASLWCGKLAAVLLLLAGSTLLVWLPTAVADGGPTTAPELLLDWPEELPIFHAQDAWDTRGRMFGPGTRTLWVDPYGWSTGPPWLWGALAVVFLVLAAHAGATILRSKSPRLLADLVLLAGVAALDWSTTTRLAGFGAWGALYRSWVLGLGGTLAALFAAGLAQTAFGRTSAKRAHAVLSTVLWGTLVPLFVGLELFSYRVVAAGLDDLAAVTSFVSAPRGDWLVVAGPARGKTGYAPVFAYHPPTGERRKIDVLQALPGSPVFSSDGRSLAWESCTASPSWSMAGALTRTEYLARWPANRETGCEVRYLDLGTPDAEPFSTGIETPLLAARPVFRPPLALAGDGRLLALVAEGRLSAWSMPSGGLLAAAEIPGKGTGVPRFEDGPRVRVYTPNLPHKELVVLELDPGERRLSEVGRLPGSAFHRGLEGEGLASWSFRTGVHVFRAGDLSEVSTVEPGPGHSVQDVRFFADSGFVGVENQFGGSSRVRRFDAEGHVLWSMELPGSMAIVGPEAAPGRFWLGVWQTRTAGDPVSNSPILLWEKGLTRWQSRLVDLETGEVVLEERELVPNWHEAEAGSPGSRLLVGRRGSLMSLDPATGEIEPLLEIGGSD